jgi:chromosome segregation ATPase
MGYYQFHFLQAKLMASSPGSEAQFMDWDHDKKRMRDSIKHERAAWDKEKKGLMDQIASLKIKATTLHMQKAPPPEWVLEKHQLTDQCSTLHSRVAILENDRTLSGNHHKTQVAKLEKKIALLRGKLMEVMEHAQEIEAKAKEDAKQAASGTKKVLCATTLKL